MPSEDALPALFAGTLALWVGFLSALVAAGAYLVAGRRELQADAAQTRWERRHEKPGARSAAGARTLLTLARGAFLLSATVSLLSAAYLMLLILTHRFDVLYVVKVSSRNQLPFYLFASFWGDQQGSFYLWLLHSFALGLILMKVARRYEAQVMGILSLLPACILWILILKNPFKVLPEPWPDGQGMSPLLENPWMAIHPPILFLGFASTTVLFAYSLAGLWRRDYDGWVRRAMPWSAFSFAVLGCGVCMGGYWAYSTLGWGGFWGWDPVENSSLFPWIAGTMLMHSLVVQRTKGVWHRTSAVLATVPFIFVLYSTFLTRSGILSEFSVHSFGSLGILWWLLGGIGLFAAMAVGTLAVRWRDLPRKASLESGYNSESAVYWGLVLLGLFGAVVIVATSWPVLSGLMVEAREKVPSLSFLPSRPASPEAAWYNRMVTPLGIMMAVAIGSMTAVRWSRSTPTEVWRKVWAPLGLSLLVGVVGYALGVRRAPALLMLVAGAWAFFSNFRIPARRPRSLPKQGAYIAHAGVGLLLMGIVGSSIYGQHQSATLVQGETQHLLGYDIQFRGLVRPEGKLKQLADIRLTRRGEQIAARPTVHLHKALGRESQWLTWPYIRKYWDHDLYIAPAGGLLTTDDLFGRGGEIPVSKMVRDGAYTFILDPHPVMVSRTAQRLELGVRVTVQSASGSEVLVPTVVTDLGTFAQLPGAAASTRDGQLRLRVSGLGSFDMSGARPSIGTATVQISGPALGAPAVNRNAVQVEFSTKPLINLVWLGTVLIVLGGLLSMRHRMRDLDRLEGELARGLPERFETGGTVSERVEVGV